MFQTIDTPKSLEGIRMERIGKNIIMDYRFCERLSGDVLEYLNGVYRFKSIKLYHQQVL